MLTLSKLSHKTGCSDSSDGGKREEGIKFGLIKSSPPPQLQMTYNIMLASGVQPSD